MLGGLQALSVDPVHEGLQCCDGLPWLPSSSFLTFFLSVFVFPSTTLPPLPSFLSFLHLFFLLFLPVSFLNFSFAFSEVPTP